MANAFGNQKQDKPIWRYITAAALDGIIATAGTCCLVAILGLVWQSGSSNILLLPAAALTTLTAAYFWIGQRHMGGTLCQRLLKAR
ncbi:hypothetical protein N9K16_04530 [Alphaproteobacteria bacterium]|jgi:hypothetical protein|nr:hypothetical protein [Alphaproteobacteria bacterium]